MNNYEKIIASNPWWIQAEQFAYNDMDLGKKLFIQFSKKEPDIKINNIYIIKGPRRIGKTYWIKNRIKNAIINKEFEKRDIFYFSFDSIESNVEFENMLRWFIIEQPHQGSILLFLDEIQNIKNWQNTIKSFYDAGILKNAAVVITGSLAYALEINELLGRIKESNIFLMQPLCFSQFIKDILNINILNKNLEPIGFIMHYIKQDITANEIKSLNQNLNQTKLDLNSNINEYSKAINSMLPYLPLLNKFFSIYLRTGGYPFIINKYFSNRNQEQKKEEINDAYFTIYTYAKNDAASLATGRPGDPIKAGKVLEITCKHIGEKISNAKMAREINLDQMTFSSYLNRLDGSFVFLRLNGIDSRLKPHQIIKYYFADVAMHYATASSYLIKDTYDVIEEIIQSNKIGLIVEEIVVNHIARINETAIMKKPDKYLKFMELNSRKEIDIVYTAKLNEPVGIEIKYQNNIDAHDIIKTKLINKNIIITKHNLEISENILFVPASLFLVLLPISQANI